MRYIPHTEEDIRLMLTEIGVQNIDTLFESMSYYPGKRRNFDVSNKFYFCENGVWHSSVFAVAEE